MTVAGADIQVENGNFSRIHNAILEAIYSGDFSLREVKCLLFLIRQTYGFQRKADTISYEQFADATGINRRHVISTMQSLVAKNVVTSVSSGNRRPQTWAFNKYIERWNLVTKTVTSTSDQNSHQIDALVTELVTSTSDQNSHQSSDQNSHPQKKERKEKKIHAPVTSDCEGEKAVTPHQEYFGAVCIIVGMDYKLLTKEQTGQVAQVVGKLQKAGYTIDDLRSFYRMWRDDWRAQNGQRPTLKQLLAEIGKLKVGELDSGVAPSGTHGNGSGWAMPLFTGSEK
jgi:phage replication O-like protein O